MQIQFSANLANCVHYLQPTPYIVKSTDYMESGDIPVLTPGKTFILGYTKEKTGIFKGPFPVIIFDDFTTATQLVNFPFKVKSSAMKILLPKDNVDIKYIFYFLQIQKFSAETHKRYWISVCAKTKLALPPMAEQKRIVRKIEELFGVIDRDIQRLTDTLEQLSQFRQSVLEKLLNSHIPNSTLGELLQPRRERIIPSLKNQEMPYVGLDSIEPGALTLSKIETLQQTKSSCFLFCKDDVLYGRMRSYLNKVFKADFKGAASAEFIVFPKSEKILPDYLKYLLHQHRFVVFATKNSSGDRPRVKFEEDLAPFHFYLPTLPEQQKIVDEIEKAFRSTDKVQKAVQNALEEAKKLKQSILKKAFAGELIPQDPNDKPVNLPVLKGQTK